MFELDDRLSKSSFKIIDLTLSQVRLKNNKNYPWLILIPRVENKVTELFQLNDTQQTELMREITRVSQCMNHFFLPDKINVGTLGNIVSQLHIHVIARSKNDALWPHSVWQESVVENPYLVDVREKLTQQLYVALS